MEENSFVRIANYTLGSFIHGAYNVGFRHTERLQPLKNQGFVLLPRHQSNLDIVLEGMLLFESIKRYGHFIMKESLPSVLKYFGGIAITRLKDLKQKTVEYIERAKGRRAEVEQSIEKLLYQNEIIVVHPEGTRNYGKPGKAERPVLKRLLALQKNLLKPITFVPLNIQYQGFYPGSKITATVGSPFRVPDNGLKELVDKLHTELGLC